MGTGANTTHRIEQNQFAITIFGNTQQVASLTDCVLPLSLVLQKFGYSVHMLQNEIRGNAPHIAFGIENAPANTFCDLPQGSIIYNTCGEQFYTSHANVLHTVRIWEPHDERAARFSAQNPDAHIQHVPLGFTPEMKRLAPDYEQNIDILCYGEQSEQVHTLLQKLRNSRLQVHQGNTSPSIERDYLIARSKVILYFPSQDSAQDAAFIAYLIANRKAVLTVGENQIQQYFRNSACILSVASADAIEQILLHVKGDAVRTQTITNTFTAFSGTPYTDILATALNVTAPDARTALLPMPTKLNAGSGKDFRYTFFNIDINSKWNPDLLLDLSAPINFSAAYTSMRFGKMQFTQNMFKHIRAFDVIEHVPDVSQFMKNMLDLLEEGGELHLNVPYDLSLGAWQDPTHRHAFNENSWLYYTSWAWYLGWKDYKFEQRSFSYIVSKYGMQLQNQGATMEQIIQSPRAVDFMELLFVKKRSTAQDILEYEKFHRGFYKNATGNWELTKE